MYDELIYKLQELVCDRIKDTDGAMLVCDAINAINALSKPRWIPVTERLPEPYKEVLLYSGEEFYTGYMHNDKRFTVNASHFPDRPTHWMPLPQPSKEEL